MATRIIRCPARRMTARYRDSALDTNDRRKKKRITKLLSILMLDDDDEDDLLFILALREYQALKYASVPPRRHVRLHLSIETFPIHGSWKGTFGFRQQDLYRVLRCLEIPETIRLSCH